MTTTWFRASDLRHLFGWSDAYVRKLAHLHGWRKVGRAPIYYHPDDVRDYFTGSARRGVVDKPST